MFGLKLEISKPAVKSGLDLAKVENMVVPVFMRHLGGVMRERVQERGDLAGQTFPGYWPRARWMATAPGYPDRAVGDAGPSGAEFYRPAAVYHRQNGTLPGSYAPTGGMWSGASTVVESPRKASDLFRGRSLGREPNFKRVGRSKRKGTKGVLVARALMINNALKAWTVLRRHRVHLLAPSLEEFRALAMAYYHAIALGVQADLPVEWSTAVPGSIHDIVRRSFAGSL